MVTITQQEFSATHYSNIKEEDGVLQAYDSVSSLIDDIKATASSMFEALSLVNEINRLNGCKIIGEYEIKIIKSHFRDIKIENIKSGICRISKKEIAHIEKLNIKRGISLKEKSKSRDLQKGYIKLLSV